MAWSAVTDANDGQSFGGAAWQSAIDAVVEMQTSAIGTDVPDQPLASPIRHRRHRNGATLGTGTVNMFAGSSTGSTVEDVGGITFTPDDTNGWFTVPLAGTYAIEMFLDPSGSLGTTSALLVTLSSAGAAAFPVFGGSIDAVANMVRYLAAGTTISFSAVNGSGGALTADVWQVEITRLAGP